MDRLVSPVLMWFRREPVLCAAALCALASMLLTPPSLNYLDYIDWRVLILLFCLMAVVAGLQECRVFACLAQRLLAGERRMRLITLVLVLLPFFSSMLFTNDVALIAFVPFAVLVMGLIGRTNRLVYIIVLQTIAANLGSMATPVGNPQNLYLYANYALAPGAFFALMVPLAAVSLIGLVLASLCVSPEGLKVHFPDRAQLQGRGQLALLLGLFLLCLLSVFHVLHELALLAVVVLCLAVFNRKLLQRVDYSLLLTFLCFFLFAGNLGGSEPLRQFITGILTQNTALASGLASQVISNVPAAVLLSHFTEDWRGLLVGTNIGGLGTPIASLASLISLKAYLRTPEARPLHYLAVFTAANLVAAGILSLAAWLVLRG